jgi:hypothetical protein
MDSRSFDELRTGSAGMTKRNEFRGHETKKPMSPEFKRKGKNLTAII